MTLPVKLAFTSGSDDLIPGFLDEMARLFPDVELMVVSEFPPPGGYRWIPYAPKRPFYLNDQRVLAAIGNRPVILAGIILQPNMPYWRMRWIAWKNWPFRVAAFNDNMGHWMLRPQQLPIISRHLLWRLRNLVVSQTMAGSATYTLFWRLRHPRAFRRPVYALAARLAGSVTQRLKQFQTPAIDPPLQQLPAGTSVVIPSYNGMHLLKTLLPTLLPQMPENGEVIVVDNGSTDGTAQWLQTTHPSVKAIVIREGLGFARASNLGIEAARFNRLLMLNNDMVLEPGFVEALNEAFPSVPELFGATAQIFFPEGVRREETGKAVRIPASRRTLDDFAVRCDLPIDGENHSYVLYGSGGCTLYDTAKMRALGGYTLDYQPAYVEDLDLGFRAWQRGWPTIFVASAKLIHFHRQTNKKVFDSALLDATVERNYLRFIASSTTAAEFAELWPEAVARLNHLAARMEPVPSAMAALKAAWRAPWQSNPAVTGAPFLALTSGEVAVFPGCKPGNKKRILIATPYMPFPLSHGGAVRMYNLMRRTAREYDQVLMVFADELEKPPQELLDICVEVVCVRRLGSHLRPYTGRPEVVEEFASDAFTQALAATVRKWQPTVAQLEFTQMAQYAKAAHPAKTILVEHDITLDLYGQLLAENEDWELRRQWELWKTFETAAWAEVDSVVTMSEKDRQSVALPKAVAIKNGVDLERFQPSNAEPDQTRLLFIGSFAHLPNLMALEFFLREVWPHLAPINPILHVIAGSRHEYFMDLYRDRVTVNLNQPNIELEGFVSDVRPAYRQATVVIAPLVASAGTNIKIIEAMAMGRAIVSTPAGINGLDLISGRDLLVAATGTAMASAIAGLIRDPASRRILELAARETAVREYSWDAIALEQLKLYSALS